MTPVRFVALPSDSFRAGDGKITIAPLTIEDVFLYRCFSDADGHEFSQVRLLEDGRPLAHPHSQHIWIRDEGCGHYSHWQQAVYFSASDDTDPRTNGRTYGALVRWRMPPALFWLLVPLGSWWLLHLLYRLARWANVKPVPEDAEIAARPETSLAAWLLPLLAAATPSILLLLLLPPLYTDVTLVQVVHAPESALTHYPPLYPYLVYGLHLAINTLRGATNGMSLAGLYALAVTQHLLLTGAIFYVALGCSRILWGRLLAIVPFYLLPVFALINHGLQTEAVWSASLIFMLGAGVRIVREATLTPRTLLGLCAAFSAGLLIRPTTLFLAPAVPGALMLILLAERSRRNLIRLVLVLLALGGATAWGSAVNRVAAAAHGRAYQSPWGRGTIEVVQRIVWRLENADQPVRTRESLVPALEAGADDPLLRNAVSTIIRFLDADYAGTGKTTVWGGAHAALQRLGTRDGDAHRVPLTLADADRLVNQFCLLFIKTYPDLILDNALRTMASYGISAFDPTAHDPEHLTSLGASFFAREGSMNWVHKEAWPLVADWMTLPMVRGSASLHAPDRRLYGQVAWLAQYLRSGFVVGFLLLALWVGRLLGRLGRRDALFVVAAMLAGLFSMVLNSFFLCFIARYQMTYEIPIACSLGLVLARLATNRATARPTVVPAKKEADGKTLAPPVAA